VAVARSRLVFHPEIVDDLGAIAAYYRELDRSLPARFRSRFREQLDRLTEFPDSGALLFGDFRRVVIKRFPYLLVYRIVSDRVFVLAIISFRRDPNWTRNLVSSRSTDTLIKKT
jgi:plasmid stabilization system protein ParE